MLTVLVAMTTLASAVTELEAVTWEMERRGLVEPDFAAWQKRARPEFSWDHPHFDFIHKKFDAVTAGDLRRLLLQVSVRHGKTECNSGYATYRLELDPATRILLGTYSQKQARKLSRTIRRLAKRRGVEMASDADAVDEWETTAGGGLRAVGAGTGVASVNADLIIIDDPIGKREEAESEAHREAIWLWITTDILARVEPHTAVVFSMPRWHADDPAGRMQSRQPDRWDVVDMPGVAEDDDVLGRAPGELLWPEYRPQQWIDEMRVDLGSYGFASAVQCRPVPRAGGMFKWAWLKDRFVDAAPTETVERIRYWDTAGTEGDGDYTAGLRMSKTKDGLFYVEDVLRGQWAPGHRDRMIVQASVTDNKMPGRYEVGLERESGVGGEERTRAIVSQLAGLSVYTERPTGSKEARADPAASQMEVGNVRIVRGDWNTPFIEELLAFPSGVHDDQVDALSGAFNRITQARNTPSVRTVRL